VKNHEWLLHALRRASGSARGAPDKSSTGTARVRATRGILIMALVLGSLGAVAAALSSHGNVGHVNSVRIIQVPWMY